MPEGSLNIGELARQLGLKNVRELPVAQEIQPVLTAEEILPPMLPPSAWAGASQGSPVGERPYIQLVAGGSGGVFVEFFHSGGAVQVEFRLDRDGVDPLAADPIATVLPKFETGFGTTQSLARVGSSTVTLSVAEIPTFFTAINFAQWQSDKGFFMPSGGIFTLNNSAANTVGYFVIRWREVPAAALTPTG